MTSPARRVVRTRAGRVALIAMGMAGLCAVLIAVARDASDFPDGFDAVQAAPASHKVIFEKMHAIEVAEDTAPPGDIPLLRVEIKVP